MFTPDPADARARSNSAAPRPFRSRATTPSLSILGRVRPHLGAFALGCLLLAGTNGLGLAIPWLLKSSIDLLSHALGAGEAARATAYALVGQNALLIAALAVAQALVRTGSRVLIFNSGRNIEYDLRRDLFGKLTSLSPAFFRHHPTGDLMSRLTNDLSSVRMLFGPGLLNIVNTAIVYATGLTLLLRLSPRLTLLALLPYPVLVVAGRIFSRGLFRTSRELQEELGRLSSAAQEDLAGIAVVKGYGLEKRRHELFARLSDRYLRRSLAVVRVRGGLMPLFAGIGGIGTLIVLWAGGREVIAGRMTVGALVAFNAYLAYLAWPTIALGWVLSLWQRGAAAWTRVRELLAARPEVEDAPELPELSPASELEPSIEVRDLRIERDGRALLDGVSFFVPAGATVAVVGPTGAGKTTLLDAIPRLQEVPRGTVFVGGRDVHDIPVAELRGMIGYAPQDPFLFSATVAENIAFGLAHSPERAADAPEVVRAAEAAGLARDVAALPEGYATLVGERGITLSGGQRQRVALARALATLPRILILDDSLSSVDAETERDILGRLQSLLAGRTAILVSHRVAAVKDADLILVMDEGRIVERGRHIELMRGGGLYATLYREQLATEELMEAAE